MPLADEVLDEDEEMLDAEVLDDEVLVAPVSCVANLRTSASLGSVIKP